MIVDEAHNTMRAASLGMWQITSCIPFEIKFCFTSQVSEAVQQYKDDGLINGIIDEVTQPHLRQVVIEVWQDVAEVGRNKQIDKVT